MCRSNAVLFVRRWLAGIATLFVATLFIATLAHADVALKGINLSGAEFGGCATPDARYGYRYRYVDTGVIDSFIKAGMNVFRLPFCWERLQPGAMGDFDAAELQRIDTLVNYVTTHGSQIVLDPHNYAAYRRQFIGSGTDPAAFVDLWSKLAEHYKNNDKVIFGLMNEPIKIKGDAWIDVVNAAIKAIRDTGARNLILVPGVAWTGAQSWTATGYGTPNSVSTLNVKDSADHYAYEVHLYFDKAASGHNAECVDEMIGVTRVKALQEWLQQHHKQAFLGEFGVARNPVCYSALTNLLDEIRRNDQLWLGWTYWNTGVWQEKYMFNIPMQPEQQADTQMDVLKKYLRPKM